MSLSVLDSPLFGPLFATDAMRAVFCERAWLSCALAVETALARVQARHGLIPESLGDALAEIGPDVFDPAALGAGTALAGVPVIPFLAALREHLPEALEPHLHKGATTQDVVDTVAMLQAREATDLLLADALAVLDGLTRLVRAHRTTPCVGRTYGQHAAPVTFGWKAAVWALGISEAAADLAAVRAILPVSLGGPAGIPTGLGEAGPAVADDLARDLRLASAPLAWHTRRGIVLRLGAALAALSGALAKMAGDIAHLMSTEVGEVAEPHQPGRGGSSAMPHKRNPVGATVILSAHAHAQALLPVLAGAMVAAHERPAGPWHGEWAVLPGLFGVLSGAAREARVLAEGLVVDPQRMEANLALTRGLIFTDAAAAALAPVLGREAAHTLVTRAAERVRDGAPSLAEALSDLGAPLAGADPFSTAPAVAAAQAWIDRALTAIAGVRDMLMEVSP